MIKRGVVLLKKILADSLGKFMLFQCSSTEKSREIPLKSSLLTSKRTTLLPVENSK
jgi:hypothetical protein